MQQLSISSSAGLLVSGGSTVLEPLTHNQKFGGSNPATAGAGREKLVIKVFNINYANLMPVGQIMFDQKTENLDWICRQYWVTQHYFYCNSFLSHQVLTCWSADVAQW